MMAAAGTFQLSHEFGICTNHHRSRQFRSLTASGKLHLLGANISSLSLRQDSWSLRLSDRIHRPLRAIPHGCNLFKCHSFLNPSHTLHNSSIKNAALELTRSCSALQSNSIVLKLVPAVTIVLFAVWVLGPLMRLSRNIFLHKSDSSWKKSSANYVMTSYLQPLLLWTGAILLCRALDPVVLPTEASEMVKQRLLNFVRSLSTVLAFAYCLSSVIQQTQKFFMETKDPADTRNMGFQFAGKAVYTAVWVAAVSLFMELLGFSTQKWLTAGGLGTVLLTLAGREIFTNFLSSAMIHATRPFVVNEWIQTKIEGYDVSGTVEHVGWWSPTIIRGEDREAVHIPNHKFTMNVVRNLTQKTHWRIKTHLAISHLDVNKINNIVADMRKVLAKNPQVEQQRLHRRVFLENVNPENQALLILVSCFVKTSHFEEYLCVKEAILLDLLRVISHHRARLATPIRTVQKIYSDDLDSMPFADSTFTRGRAAANRPLLLIEPPYKVNGEDKTKSQTRSTRINVDQDSKASRPTSDNNQVDAKGGTSDTKTKEKSTPESKMRQSSSLDTKVNSKAGDVPNPDKAVEKEKHLSKYALKADPKSAKVSSDSNASPVSDNSAENKPKKKPLSETGGDNKANGVASTSSRPVLEENIVLGVALDGSKRTLPIEEEMAPSATAPEVKELATFRSGSGSPPADKDSKKDGQNSYVPGSTPADQCDHAAQI